MRRAMPYQYSVGDKTQGADFSPEEIDALVHKIALWFRDPKSERSFEDPLKVAKQRVKECLLGLTTEGKTWHNCPAEFAARIRAKTNFDMATNEGIVPSPPKAPRGRPRKPTRTAEEKETAAETAKAVMRPGTPVMPPQEQEKFRAKVEQDVIAAFPELDNPASLPNVRSLSMLYVQREVIDRELAVGVPTSRREALLKALKLIEEMADTQLRRLGIHSDQIRKRIADRAQSSIGDLVSLVSKDEEFIERERIWALQAALQLWWMTEHRNGRNDGPQLHPFEVWHMTRSRPVKFTCRHGETYTIVEGFTPGDLRDYLLARGCLVERPVLPTIPEEGLKGLSTFVAGMDGVPPLLGTGNGTEVARDST